MNPLDNERVRTENKNHIFLRLTIFLLLIGAAIALYETGFFHLFFSKDRVMSFLDSLGPFAFVGFVVLQAIQVVLAPIPGEVTGLIGGYTYGIPLGIALSTMGLVLGSCMAFALSRAFGRPFVERFVAKSVMDRFDYLLHHKGIFLIFLLFLLPGFPKDYLCFVLGLGHLSVKEFLLVSSIGRLLGTVMLTLGGGYIRYHQYGRLYILVGIALLATCLVLVFRKKLEGWLKIWHARHCSKMAVPHKVQWALPEPCGRMECENRRLLRPTKELCFPDEYVEEPPIVEKRGKP